MKKRLISLAVGVILLLIADALAFHDLFEPHAARDWLMLAGSALALAAFVGEFGSTLRIRSGAG